MKVNKILFAIFDGIAKILYVVREDYLQRLNDYFDKRAGQHSDI